jgi:para-nitrobenzyl esterase
MNDLVIETSSGPVRGFLDRDVPHWRGVPYGRIEHRFRPAVPATPGPPIEAAQWGPVAWQVPISAGNSWKLVYEDAVEAEDCLNLNIWSPAADGKPRPVLVWLHPGAYVHGSGSAPGVDAWLYAALHDAVIVTANYRLGPWGGLYFGDLDPEFADSANLFVRDQILLLGWIRDNIARFGGDPGNVCLFGGSSGGSDVSTLLAAPAARGLFHKAAIYSGSFELATRDEAAERAKRFLAEAGSLASTPSDLAALPNVALRHIHKKLLEQYGRVQYGPFVDGTVVPQSAIESIQDGLAADIPLLVSVTAEEARLYDLFSDQMVDTMYAAESGPDPAADHEEKLEFLTSKLYHEPAKRLLAAAHEAGGRGWWQMFDHLPSTSPVAQHPLVAGKAVHGVDQPALFVDPHGTEGTEADRAVAAEQQSALMGLARDGKPGWGPWSPAQPAPHRITP